MSAAVKVLRFLDRDPVGLERRWAEALADADADAVADANSDGGEPGRPTRVAVAAPLPGFGPPAFAAVDIQWFSDLSSSLANDGWLASVDPHLRDSRSLVVAEEVVLRGNDYLDCRWRLGGERLKMMSFGRRSPALTLQEFSARWRQEAGRLGAQHIPDEVRGLAYVQNHPIPMDGEQWPFDAVNEVYFERLDHLRQRRDWFAARPVPAGLMSPTETWSLFLRETPIT